MTAKLEERGAILNKRFMSARHRRNILITIDITGQGNWMHVSVRLNACVCESTRYFRSILTFTLTRFLLLFVLEYDDKLSAFAKIFVKQSAKEFWVAM